MKTADMHCDTISEIFNRRRNGENVSLLENDLHIDIRKLEAGDYLIQNFALYTDLMRESEPYVHAMELVDTFYTEVDLYPDRIRPVRTWEEIEENRKNGRISALLALEEGGVCLGSLGLLRDFYRLGVRMMTLTWNYPNELGFPNRLVPDVRTDKDSPAFLAVPDTEHGLTGTGIEFLREMERIGMIVDISHLNDAGIWDVFRYTKKPLVASHSNCRALAGHPRNLTDEMLRMLAQRGGVAGVNFCASFLRDEEDGRPPVHSRCEDMVRHMEHMRRVGGIGCIGLGSDFDGITSLVEMKDCSGMQLLADEMGKRGFHESEVEKVFSGNVLRVYRECLQGH